MTFPEFNLVFLGMIFVMLIFNTMLYFLQRDKVYLYYSLYMVCWLIYFGFRFLDFVDERTNNFLRISAAMMAYFFNFDFAAEFLNLKNRLPKFYSWLKYIKIALVFYVFTEFVFCYLTNIWQTPLDEIVHSIVRLSLAIVSIFLTIKTFQIKEKLVNYFATGSLLLIVFGMIAMFTTIFGLEKPTSTQYWEAPLFYLQIGIVLELICFSLGLSYKNKLTENQKLTFENELNTEREQRKIEQLEARLQTQEISKQITDLRVKALRAQMNPHFLFNSLNAIQECIITQQTDAAVSYLAKFSKLVRLILENSESQTISLAKEIETLYLYLDVEGLRFAEKFKYQINVKTHLDPSLLSIPPMLVQPYAENAIWHGLLNKNGERFLKIDFSSDDDSLFVSIEDNGIGRQKADSFKNPTKKEHTSLGMKLTSERINILNELNPTDAKAEIEDLFDKKGASAGTRIKLTLPLG